MKKFFAVAFVLLIFMFALGYWRGTIWANIKCYQIGYDDGYYSGVSDKIAEEKSKKEGRFLQCYKIGYEDGYAKAKAERISK